MDRLKRRNEIVRRAKEALARMRKKEAEYMRQEEKDKSTTVGELELAENEKKKIKMDNISAAALRIKREERARRNKHKSLMKGISFVKQMQRRQADRIAARIKKQATKEESEKVANSNIAQDNPRPSTSAQAQQEIEAERAELAKNKKKNTPEAAENSDHGAASSTDDPFGSTSPRTARAIAQAAKNSDTNSESHVSMDESEPAELASEAIYKTHRVPQPNKIIHGIAAPDIVTKIQHKSRQSTIPQNWIRNMPSHGKPPPKIFEDSKKVFSSEAFDIYVKRDDFKVSSEFDSTDRLYRINVVTKEDEEIPLMIDSLNVIKEVLEHVVTDLQKAYDSGDKYRQVYMTLNDKKQFSAGGINTENFNLRADKSDIISQCLNRFFIFLESHKNMLLTNTFYVDVKILGVEHISHRLKERNNIAVHAAPEHLAEEADDTAAETTGNLPTGATEKTDDGDSYFVSDPTATRLKWRFSPPSGFPGHKLLLANKCLLVAAILGVCRNRYLYAEFNHHSNASKYRNDWLTMSAIHGFTRNKTEAVEKAAAERAKRAGLMIWNEIQCLCKNTGIDVNANFYIPKVTLPIIARYYSCQFVVYSDRLANRISFMTPMENLSDNISTVLLYQEGLTTQRNAVGGDDQETKDHIYLILNQCRFQRIHSFQCYHCKKLFASNRPQHACIKKVNKVLLTAFFCFSTAG